MYLVLAAPRRPSSAGWVGRAVAVPAPGGDDGGCNAGRRPAALLEVAAADDQQPVEALAGRCRPSAPRRRSPWAPVPVSEYLAPSERKTSSKAGELCVAVAEQEAHPRACSSRLISRLRACCVTQAPSGCGHAGEVDLAGVQLDEEQYVEPPQQDGVDGEEVAGEHPRGLPAEELPPGRVRSPWRRVQPVAARILRIAVAETLMPSFRSSPWMRW